MHGLGMLIGLAALVVAVLTLVFQVLAYRKEK
jgi:hypothetical protein